MSKLEQLQDAVHILHNVYQPEIDNNQNIKNALLNLIDVLHMEDLTAC